MVYPEDDDEEEFRWEAEEEEEVPEGRGPSLSRMTPVATVALLITGLLLILSIVLPLLNALLARSG